MRILLDTNIFIAREDNLVLSDSLQQLLSILQQLKATLLVHPLSIKELRNDPDNSRRDIIISKIKAYPYLELPPNPEGDPKYLDFVQPIRNAHDEVDSHIIYSVYKDAVDFLITEDKDIHRKAVKLSIDNRVLLISEALSVFRGHIQRDSLLIPPALKQMYVYNLDINDAFFDSLKSSYPEFSEWFVKISREGRRCLVYNREDGSIGALLIFKVENEPIDTTPPLPPKKRLKISTFKVAQLGYKIGELFIKLSVDIALANNCYEVYLTHFVEAEDRLVELITEFGFYRTGVNPKGEDVFIKELLAPKELSGLLPFDVIKRYYPSFYEGSQVQKFIVPIRPRYHARLFTNYKDRQADLSEYAGYFIVEGNTIEKAYICHSHIKSIAKGDIILFYVSERKLLITLGVVQNAYTNLKSCVDIVKLVGKRSVYSISEIEAISKQPALVLMFWQYFHFVQPLSYATLTRIGVLKGAPRSIMQITDNAYVKIKEAGGIDKRFTVN